MADFPVALATDPAFWHRDGNHHKPGKQLSQENGGSERQWRRYRVSAVLDPANKDLDFGVRVATGVTVTSKLPTGKASYEKKSDGSAVSTRFIEMRDAQSRDEAFVLEKHGFDPEAWEIVSMVNNLWNMGAKDGAGEMKLSLLYQSKITVKPKVSGVSAADIVELALNTVTPLVVPEPDNDGEKCLSVEVHDAHFGNSTFAQYERNLSRIIKRINRRVWEEIVLPCGSDLFHCDNFKNTTSNGTLQSSVAWPEAWADALKFYSAIIEAALEQSQRVYLYYIIGNHDESMAWAFCHFLAARYPQLICDLDIEERKVHVFYDVAIGLTHGDNRRTRKDLDRIFMAEFDEFRHARIREVHSGHFHHESSLDVYGTMTRSMPTGTRADKWHREEGYVGTQRRWIVWDCDRDAVNGTKYV